MNSDIANTVGMLRQRIRKLQQMEQMLVEEFGDAPTPSTAVSRTATKGPSNGNANGGLTRQQQLTAFLIEHGPASRGTINEKSGIPKGTVAALLSKGGFVLNAGKWYVPGHQSPATQEITQ